MYLASYIRGYINVRTLESESLRLMLKSNGSVESFLIVSNAKFIAGINPVKSKPVSREISTPRRRVCLFPLTSVKSENTAIIVMMITVISQDKNPAEKNRCCER